VRGRPGQLSHALVDQRGVVVRVREVGLELDRAGEGVARPAPVARFARREAQLIEHERIVAGRLRGLTRQRDRAARIAADQRLARLRHQLPRGLVGRVEARKLFAGRAGLVGP